MLGKVVSSINNFDTHPSLKQQTTLTPISIRTWDNVRNHVKILKNRYNLMNQAICLSVGGWDNDTQIITLHEVTCTSCEAGKLNSKLLNFVNKPLKHLEVLRLTVEDDGATGAFSKSVFEDLDSQQSEYPSNVLVEDSTPIEVTQFEARKNPEVMKASASRATRVPRKRNKIQDKVQEEDRELSMSLDRVAIALLNITGLVSSNPD